MKKKTAYIGLTALALSMGGGLYALAQTAQPAQTPGTQQTQRADYWALYLQKLAAALGVDQAKLTAAFQSAGNATVDQALKDGAITQTQADAAKQRIQNGGGFGLRGFGGPGMERGGRGHGADQQDFGGPAMRGRGPSAGLDAAAKALNTTTSDLVTQLRGGKTLTQVAQSKNVNPQTVKDAVLAALKTDLSQAVSAGRLGQAQADQMLTQAGNDPNFGLFGEHGLGR